MRHGSTDAIRTWSPARLPSSRSTERTAILCTSVLQRGWHVQFLPVHGTNGYTVHKCFATRLTCPISRIAKIEISYGSQRSMKMKAWMCHGLKSLKGWNTRRNPLSSSGVECKQTELYWMLFGPIVIYEVINWIDQLNWSIQLAASCPIRSFDLTNQRRWHRCISNKWDTTWFQSNLSFTMTFYVTLYLLTSAPL